METDVQQLIRYARDEIALRREQGCDTWEWERLVALFESDPGPSPLKRARSLVRSIRSLEPDEDYPYEEPGALDAIRAMRPEGPRSIATGLAAERLDDATLGSWRAQAAGCMLGKPVRRWHRVKIDGLMRVCQLGALDDYIPPTPDGRGFDFPASARSQLRGNIERAERDPALDFSVLALRIIEEHGTGLTSGQVARRWLQDLPYGRLQDAQAAAYRNLVNKAMPPQSAVEMNPYREWTGAMSRGCAWGRALPGRPQQAAELAWHDARVSHERNGLYAAMWAAAATSAAFAASSARQALEVGLTEVPSQCRLAGLFGQMLDAHDAGRGPADVVEEVMKQYRSHSPMHVLSNAAVVAVGLLWGEGDFSRTVGLVVQAGQDTTGNAATAGAICGALAGAQAIPAHWSNPLEDTLETALAGTGPLSIRELADRTRRVQDRIAGRSGP